jgi:hypothetical protein
MSSSATSSFSFVPEMLQHSMVIDDHLKAKIQTAFHLAVKYTNSEHHTARCALMLALLIFSTEDWTIVPQFYTNTGKWPDFVFERFYYRPGHWREALFTANVFLEFKVEISRTDPIEQLKESILNQHGPMHRSKGVLIGVKGVQWRFVEYQFVQVPNQKEPLLLLIDFHDFTRGPARVEGRPTPSRDYAQGEYMDFRLETEGKDILKALLWVMKGKHNRDLTFLRHHATALPQSFTHSTLGGSIVVEARDENLYKLSPEFDYILPLLDEEVRGD